MAKIICLLYPCGKRWELKIPITITKNGSTQTILPTNDDYFQYAKERFEINNLRVVEVDIDLPPITKLQRSFVSLVRKKTSIE